MPGVESYTYNCRSSAVLAQLEKALIAAAAGALGTASLGMRPPQSTPNRPEATVIGGAHNVYLDTGSGVPVDPSVLDQASTPEQSHYEKGWQHQLIVPATKGDGGVPGPGNWIHVLFNTETNAQGQVLVTAAKVHADIGNPRTGDLAGPLGHLITDVLLAAGDAKKQGACAVKIF